jgi:hypothetical protein
VPILALDCVGTAVGDWVPARGANRRSHGVFAGNEGGESPLGQPIDFPASGLRLSAFETVLRLILRQHLLTDVLTLGSVFAGVLVVNRILEFSSCAGS